MKKHLLILTAIIALGIVCVWQMFSGISDASEKAGRPAKVIKLDNEYVVKLYLSGKDNIGAGYDAFEIVHKKKRVYFKKGNRYSINAVINKEIASLDEKKNKESIGDITGDGIPDLIISEWTGGAHCCSNTIILSLGRIFKETAYLKGEHTGFEIEDIDGDGIYEAKGNDWVFGYWQASFADSPAPEIILRYKNGKYLIAADLMSMHPPDEKKINAEIELVKKDFFKSDGHYSQHQDPPWSKSGGVPPKLWGYMLDLIYTGSGDLAFQFFNKAWPEGKEGKTEFLNAFKKQLSKSPYWKDIKVLNKWK